MSEDPLPLRKARPPEVKKQGLETCAGPQPERLPAPAPSTRNAADSATPAPRPGEPPGEKTQEAYAFLAPPEEPGELGRLGAYRVLKLLGEGGMGTVFQAEDTSLQRLVALKVMKPNLTADATARQRFLREARATAALKNDHIVTIYQVGQEQGVFFLAMELLEGESLKSRLERIGKLSLTDVLRISRELAEGLAAAHERGLIHRDIKPANVWLEGARASVKILDFGLARKGPDDSSLTQFGMILGTPAYMAPEQARAEKVDARCDLFSLGCVLYHMGTGSMPFRGDDPFATMAALVSEQPPPPREVNPKVPQALSDLTMRLLAKAPAGRPQSAREVIEQIENIAYSPRTELFVPEDEDPDLAGAAGVVLLHCSHCSKPYLVKQAFWGKRARCKKCGKTFRLTPPHADSAAESGSCPPGPVHPPLSEAAGAPGGRRRGKDGVAELWRPGDVIVDLYEVKGVLGEGRLGMVHQVWHRGWGVDLAVKSPGRKVVASAAGAERFERGAESWGDLGQHPHAVHCFYARNLGGLPRVFAEYVGGGSLASWLRGHDGQPPTLYAGGPAPSLARILDIAIQVAWGLHHAHAQGLVHQDVKPANVLMTPDALAKVTDFGLAAARAGGGGTVAYCSPEQAELAALRRARVPRDRQPGLTRQTDLWSWGVSLLEMFAGEPPRRDGGWQAAEALATYLRTPAGRGGLPAMPPGVVEVLQRCFLREPGARPRDMLAVADTLREVYRRATGTAYPRETPDPAATRADDLNNRAVALQDLRTPENADKILARAEQLWEEALRLDPRHAEAACNLAMARWRSGRLSDDSLVRRLRELQTAHPDQPAYTDLLRRVFLERGQGAGAAALKVVEGGRESQGLPSIAGYLPREPEAANDDPLRARGCLRTFEVHGDIFSTCLSADGRYALSGSDPSTLKLWEVGTGNCLRTLQGSGPVLSACLSADGRFALSGGGDQMVRLWELDTGRCLRTFQGHTGAVEALCLSLDGRYALSGGEDWTLRLWEVGTGRCLSTLEGHAEAVAAVCLSPDGDYAVSGGKDNALKLWKLPTGQCLRTFVGHDKWVNAVSLNADRFYLLSGSVDGSLKLWEADTGYCLRTFEGHMSWVTAACLSPDGYYALSGSRDGTLKLWEADTGRCLRTFEGHAGAIWSACLSSDGRQALSGGEDRTLKLWGIEQPAADNQVADRGGGAKQEHENFLLTPTKPKGTPRQR